jgi:hypothetical protein
MAVGSNSLGGTILTTIAAKLQLVWGQKCCFDAQISTRRIRCPGPGSESNYGAPIPIYALPTLFSSFFLFRRLTFRTACMLISTPVSD